MRKRVKDHIGNEYPSVKAMYEAWGLDAGTYYCRIKAGRTLEETLTGKGSKPPRGRREASCKPITDHIGRKFFSEKEMCKAWNIDYSNYKCRRAAGWNLQKILETPVKRYIKKHRKATKDSNTPLKHRKKYYMDHLRKRYKTEKEMCAAWNISWYTYRTRIKAGWSKRDALTTPARYTRKE